MPSNVLLLNLKQTFPPIIQICTEGEGDGIKSKLPFKIFSTLCVSKRLLIIYNATIAFLFREMFLSFCSSASLLFCFFRKLIASYTHPVHRIFLLVSSGSNSCVHVAQIFHHYVILCFQTSLDMLS